MAHVAPRCATHYEYMVFIAEQNLVDIDAVVSAVVVFFTPTNTTQSINRRDHDTTQTTHRKLRTQAYNNVSVSVQKSMFHQMYQSN